MTRDDHLEAFKEKVIAAQRAAATVDGTVTLYAVAVSAAAADVLRNQAQTALDNWLDAKRAAQTHLDEATRGLK